MLLTSELNPIPQESKSATDGSNIFYTKPPKRAALTIGNRQKKGGNRPGRHHKSTFWSTTG